MKKHDDKQKMKMENTDEKKLKGGGKSQIKMNRKEKNHRW